MSTNKDYPSLEGWEPTRDTLSAYAKAIGVVPRALAEPHPKWWHISLKVQPEGFATDAMPRPSSSSATFKLLMNLKTHTLVIATSDDEIQEISLTEGLSATAFGDGILGALAAWGIQADYERARFENDEPRSYNPDHAGRYLEAIVSVDRALKAFKATIDGETGPVQLWPHHFDLAFEWFGTKTIPYEEHGKTEHYPSQINFGFSPGGGSHPRPYFYANPWPFDEAFRSTQLPSGARWFTEGWQGSLLPYASIAGEPEAERRLSDYFRAVFETAAPSLTGNP